MKKQTLKRWLAGVLVSAVLCQGASVAAFAESDIATALSHGTALAGESIETQNATYTISQLRLMFPHGKYWNHANNPGSGNNNPMGYSSTPCTSHGSKGYNSATCNHPTFGYYYGCWGYADQLGYLYTGSNPETWTKSTSTSAIDSIKTGDIIRFTFNSGAEHSIFVTSVSGNTVYYTDCNQGGKCDIAWDRSKTKDYLKSHMNYVRVCSTGPNPNHCDCSTAYAGWYKVKSGGVNVNSGHNFNSYAGELAGGTHIYVNKASGLGRSQIGHITYNGRECYVAMNLLEECDHNPKGSVDSWGGDLGSVYVNGWAFDYDNTGAQLAVNVYLDGVWAGAGYANTNRSDIENSYPGVGAYHGFSIRVGTQLTGSHKLEVWASNVGSGNDVCLRSTTVNIPADGEPPTLSDWKASNITADGFDVSCVSTDNVGVDHVEVRTWTDANGQDDLKVVNATQNGNTFTYHVNISDHNNERGLYKTIFKTYDKAGNWRYNNNPIEVTVPEPYANVTFDANGGSAEFVSKTVPYGDAYGVLPEASCTGYIFDGWYTEPTGGQKVTKDTACNTYGEVRLYAQWKPTSAGGWSFSNGVLTIDCRGAMENFDSAVEAPWFSVRSQVERIVVTEGVTSLSDYAFFGCENAESITLPTSLERIGKLSLYGCKSLSNLTIPSAVAEIGDYAFARASGLKQVVFEGTAPQIGAGAFAEVPAEIIYPANDPSWTESVQQSYTGRLTWTVYDAAALDLETELAVAE